MKCQQQLSVRSSAGVLEAPSGYALRGLQDIKAKRTVYLLRNRTILFATNIAMFHVRAPESGSVWPFRAACRIIARFLSSTPDFRRV